MVLSVYMQPCTTQGVRISKFSCVGYIHALKAACLDAECTCVLYTVDLRQMPAMIKA